METAVTRREIEPGIWVDGRRALWFDSSRTLVVADLHWGYAASHRAAGNLLPVWGDGEIARTLDQLAGDYQPRETIWLGDIIHAAAGRRHAEEYLAAAPGPVIILRGNHDRSWRRAGLAAVIKRHGFTLHHGDVALPPRAGAREMIGHHHPAAVWSDRAGARLRLPALVTGPRRWILPAFSPWSAGTPWNHLLEPDETLWAVAPRRIFAVTRRTTRAPS